MPNAARISPPRPARGMRTVLPATAMRGDSTACQTPRANPRPAGARNADGSSGKRMRERTTIRRQAKERPVFHEGALFVWQYPVLRHSAFPHFSASCLWKNVGTAACRAGKQHSPQPPRAAHSSTASPCRCRFRLRQSRHAGGTFPPSQPPRTAHPLTASPRRCRFHLRQPCRAAIGFPYSVSTSSESRPRMTRVPCPGDDSISIVCPRRARMRLHRYSPMPVARRSPSRPLKPV